MDIKMIKRSMAAMVIISAVWALIITGLAVAAVVLAVTVSAWFWLAVIVTLGMAVVSWIGVVLTFLNTNGLRKTL